MAIFVDEGCVRIGQSSLNYRPGKMKEPTSNEMTDKPVQNMNASGNENMSEVVSVPRGCRHFSSMSAIVLSAVVACGLNAITEWKYAADVYRHVLSTTTELWSAATDQKVILENHSKNVI